MYNKKQTLDALINALDSAQTAIYWLDKAGKRLESGVMYDVIAETGRQIGALAEEIKNEISNH